MPLKVLDPSRGGMWWLSPSSGHGGSAHAPRPCRPRVRPQARTQPADGVAQEGEASPGEAGGRPHSPRPPHAAVWAGVRHRPRLGSAPAAWLRLRGARPGPAGLRFQKFRQVRDRVSLRQEPRVWDTPGLLGVAWGGRATCGEQERPEVLGGGSWAGGRGQSGFLGTAVGPLGRAEMAVGPKEGRALPSGRPGPAGRRPLAQSPGWALPEVGGSGEGSHCPGFSVSASRTLSAGGCAVSSRRQGQPGRALQGGRSPGPYIMQHLPADDWQPPSLLSSPAAPARRPRARRALRLE